MKEIDRRVNEQVSPGGGFERAKGIRTAESLRPTCSKQTSQRRKAPECWEEATRRSNAGRRGPR